MKHSLSIPLILFATLLIWTLMTPTDNLLRPAPPPTPAELRIPDSYASDITTSEFNEQGILKNRMKARALRRYRGSDLVELDNPQRDNFDDGGTWTASALHGLLRENIDTLQLRGAVTLRYDSEGVEFLSESMLINVPRRTARSLAPVELVQGENRIAAPNMFIALDSERATLSGGVTSSYAPPR